MVTDIVGSPITEGAVITWCGRQSSNMFLSVGVVRAVKEERDPTYWDAGKMACTITADRLGADQSIRHGRIGERFRVRKHYFRRVQLGVPDYITVTGLTEDELKRRFPFEEREEAMTT